MPRLPAEELPHDLAARRALYTRVVVLGHSVFDARPTTEPWRPPILVDPTIGCPATTDAIDEDLHFEFVNPLREYNLRLANAAAAVAPIAEPLRIAGMSNKDLKHWKAHLAASIQIQCDPLSLPSGDGHLYIRADDYKGTWTNWEEGDWIAAENKLSAARGLFERTAQAVLRILRTVGPEAVLERIAVERQECAVIFDDRIYENLTEHETSLMHYLRIGAGEWVSSIDIAEKEGLTQFKVALCRKSLAKRHPALGHIIDFHAGHGGRIVLPQPEA